MIDIILGDVLVVVARFLATAVVTLRCNRLSDMFGSCSSGLGALNQFDILRVGWPFQAVSVGLERPTYRSFSPSSFGMRLRRSEAPLLGAVDLHDDAVLDDQIHGAEFQATKRITHVAQFVFTGLVVSRRLSPSRLECTGGCLRIRHDPACSSLLFPSGLACLQGDAQTRL